MGQFILDLIDRLSAGLVAVASQPAAAAIGASLVTLLGTLLISRSTERRAVEHARLEYLRRRHDRFEAILDELAATLPKWRRDEAALVAMYAKSMADDQDQVEYDDVANQRQQITNKISRLRALAPAGLLPNQLDQFDEAWAESNSDRKQLENAIGPWELPDDAVQEAYLTSLNSITAVQDALDALIAANASHVNSDDQQKR